MSPTERARSEQALRESEAKFRALAEASPAAIFIAQDGRIIYANPALEALTGYRPDDLIGMDPAGLLRASDEARNPRHEVQVQTRGGDERWIDLTTAPIVYDGGAAIVGTGIEITDRKRLERRVQQAQRLEAVGRLAGGVAHDFNNLLLVISGETERLIDGLPPNDPLRVSAESIARAAERAASLTEQLLAFGRRQTLIARSVDVNQVVSGLEGFLRDMLGDGVHVVTDPAPELPPVRVDPTRLEQVLMNLTTNAREAMDGRGLLTIATDLVEVDEAMKEGRPWLPDGQWVRLQVSDTGPGVADSAMAHVFEPFFSTKGAGLGIGLGLSTAYGIVKQSNGYVWIENQRGGGGARVIILLPPLGLPAAAPRLVEPVAAAVPRLLLIDDEQGVREMLTAVLESNEFEVASASTAEAALEILARDSFDILLTDVVLPGMMGPELARRVRALAPRTRVLFMSGYTGDAVLDEADLDDERAFIHKPFSTRALVARLRSLLAEPFGGPKPSTLASD